MNEIISALRKYRLLPVIKLDSSEYAKPLGRTLMNGCLPLAEVTFRTEVAAESIRIMKAEFPTMYVGAGSLVTKEQALAAAEAGACFFVSPGFSLDVADIADKKNIPYFAGCATPTDLITCIQRGYDIVKFFPAQQNGGLSTIKAISAAFPNVQFIPTGGINSSNIKEYLNFEKVIACGGSWIVDSKLISAGEFDKMEHLIKEALELIRSK